MHKLLLVVLAITLLSGCTGPAQKSDAVDDSQDPVVDDFVNEARSPDGFSGATLVSGSFPWHDKGATISHALGLAEYVAQNVVPGCLDPATGEPDGWNLRLDTTGFVPNGTAALSVSFSWAEDAYIRDELVLAYKPAGLSTWLLSDYITNGKSIEVPVASAEWEAGGESDWELAACLVREEHRNVDSGTQWRPGSFSGVLDVAIEAV